MRECGGSRRARVLRPEGEFRGEANSIECASGPAALVRRGPRNRAGYPDGGLACRVCARWPTSRRRSRRYRLMLPYPIGFKRYTEANPAPKDAPWAFIRMKSQTHRSLLWVAPSRCGFTEHVPMPRPTGISSRNASKRGMLHSTRIIAGGWPLQTLTFSYSTKVCGTLHSASWSQ